MGTARPLQVEMTVWRKKVQEVAGMTELYYRSPHEVVVTHLDDFCEDWFCAGWFCEGWLLRPTPPSTLYGLWLARVVPTK